MSKKKCFSINNFFQLEKLIEEKKKKQKIIIIYISDYLVTGFGLEWLRTFINLTKKKYRNINIKFYIDSGSNPGLSVILLKENINQKKIFVTGNTVIDALFLIVKKARETQFEKDLIEKIPFLNSNNKFKTKIVLVTGHRRENFGLGFENICKSLKKIASNFPSVKIIYPVHLNPNVKKPVKRILSKIDNVFLIDPLDYLFFVKLMDLSYLIMTDSGGIQDTK